MTEKVVELPLGYLDKLTPEYMDKMVAEGAASRDRFRAAGEGYLTGDQIRTTAFPLLGMGPHKFSVLSLGAWLAVAERAGVAAIPARALGKLGTDIPIRSLDQDLTEEESYALDLFWQGLQGVEETEMVRWDCCAGEDIKYEMGMGRPMEGKVRGWWVDDEVVRINFDDPRLIDILADYPHREVTLWARPIVKPRRRPGRYDGVEGSYPCEWRCFVRTINGKATIAVSNYYPQSPAPEVETGQALRAAIETRSIVEYMEREGLLPHHPIYDRGAPPGIHCTIDFMELEDGSMVAVDFGPPHTKSWGAHPCCFMGRVPEGIALAAPEGWEGR